PGQRAPVLVVSRVGERRNERRQEVAVRHVHFDQVEAGVGGKARGGGKVGDDGGHVGPRHFARHGTAAGKIRNRRRRDERPSAFGQRFVVAFPQALCRSLPSR